MGEQAGPTRVHLLCGSLLPEQTMDIRTGAHIRNTGSQTQRSTATNATFDLRQEASPYVSLSETHLQYVAQATNTQTA